LRVLLTGASGFIGSQLTAALRDAGHEVIAAVRNPDRIRRRFPGITAYAVDLNRAVTAEDWRPLLDGVDAVVNCAGILHSRGSDRAAAIHAASPIALFRCAAEQGVGKIVQISAVSIDADTEYARTKAATDRALQELAIDWTILRPSLVYGRTAYGGTAMLRALAATPFVLPQPGNGEQQVTPIHVDDLARTVRIALEDDRLRRKILSPCGPETMTLHDMLTGYRRWLGIAEGRTLHVPRPLLMAMGWLGNLFGTGPVTTTSVRQLAFGNAADPAAFAAAIGFVPRSFAAALASEPAGTADLWHARLYLFRPLIRLALITLWTVSGLVGLLVPASAIAEQSGWPGLPVEIARAASLIDLLVAGLLLAGRWPRLSFAVQMTIVTGYTLVLSLAAPHLWLDLYGPLLKNLAVLALIVVLRISEEER
jgi:uncharacterized protein YbjT (DUF2867 family)